MTYNVKVWIEGYSADLYGLSLLYCEGVSEDFQVVTEILGEPRYGLHAVTNTAVKRTYVTGLGVQAVEAAYDHRTAKAICDAALRPLNGYAILCDANFVPVKAVAASVQTTNGTREIVFANNKRQGLITSMGRHENLKLKMQERVEFMRQNEVASRAMRTLGERPGWSPYSRLLEDIAGHTSKTLATLHTIDLMTPEQNNAFTKAANNRRELEENPRHGFSKQNNSVDQASLMNLVEARELVRSAVSKWIDREVGNRMPTCMVDHMGELRFGIGE